MPLLQARKTLDSDWPVILQTVSAISHSAQTVTFSNGLGTQSKDIEELPYEYLVLAPGSIARRLPISGAEDPAEGGFENVFTVRGITDIKKIDAGALSCFLHRG
jgi:NADPH-dependent 2,4-dienoyl-CoA reductase/sulfur reductase-like enzyme